MTDGTFRGRWVDEVFRSPVITDAVRVALLAMVPDMDDAGRVSVAREDLAVRINKGKARVTERLNAAIDAGLLERTLAGKKGQVAEYAARLPKGSANPDPIQESEVSGKGPLIRTESDHFGSGLQTQTSEIGSGLQTLLNACLGPDERTQSDGKGPDGRTQTDEKGSANPDPLYRGVVDVVSDVDEVASDGLFDESVAPRRPQPKRKRSSSPKTTVPEDFAVTDEMRVWAAEHAPDVKIDIETKIFINHFADKGIKRPGWRRSWDNWMLRAQSWAPQRDNVRQLRPTGTDGRHAPGSGSDVPARNAYDPKKFI